MPHKTSGISLLLLKIVIYPIDIVRFGIVLAILKEKDEAFTILSSIFILLMEKLLGKGLSVKD